MLKALLAIALCVVGGLRAADAQDFRGRINGTVSDNTGAVLPGVTVTASSPALIQPQVQVTGADGGYRFLALAPGVYDVNFELAGFQTVKREGIRVVINQTLSVDQQMPVATLQETVTVTGGSPIVDTTTTSMGTNFTKELQDHRSLHHAVRSRILRIVEGAERRQLGPIDQRAVPRRWRPDGPRGTGHSQSRRDRSDSGHPL
jgi:hypothetical protein